MLFVRGGDEQMAGKPQSCIIPILEESVCYQQAKFDLEGDRCLGSIPKRGIIIRTETHPKSRIFLFRF